MSKKPIMYIGLAAFLIVLYLTSLYNYLLFHSLAELFSIIVAFTLFTLAWNLREKILNNYLLFVGISYFFIGLLDLLHTLSYKGMNIFTDYDYYANQLWIATRYMESLSLLVAYFFISPKRRVQPFVVFSGYVVLTIFIIASIFIWKIFPTCFVEGQGLSLFKKASEYVISFILLVDIGLLVFNRRHFERHVYHLLIWSLSLTIVSELAFTFYISNYGFSNLVGHYAKLFSFWLIYRAIIETGLVKPFDLVFLELARAKTAAEKANVVKSEFLAQMSHEIKTPMTAVIGLTDLTLQTNLADDQKNNLIIVKEAANHLLDILHDILEFSKLEAGKIKLETVDFDLPQLVGKCAHLFKYQAEKKGLTLAVEIHPQTPACVKGDPTRIKQILTNLISNAVKFTPEGRIDIRVAPGVDGEAPGCYFAVQDTGIGIPASKRNQIFESFSQVDRSTTRKYGGTGLGLAICRQLTELMGGKIEFQAPESGGSLFYFTLPFQPGDAANQCQLPITQPLEPASADEGIKILVGEDNPINAMVIEKMLYRLGHTPVIANDGRQVLNVLNSHQVDLLLLDLEMPIMDGYETAGRIRQGEAGAHARTIPIVCMTAHSLPDIKNQAEEAGMNEFVTKPIDFYDLGSLLKRYHPVNSPMIPKQNDLPDDAPTPILDIQKALRFVGGDTELYRDMIQVFIDHLPEQIDVLETALEKNDLAHVSIIAHSIKGSSEIIGARKVTDTALILEQSTKDNRRIDRSIVETLLADLKQLKAHLNSSIDDLRSRVQPGPSK